jgi:hypothetical protein
MADIGSKNPWVCLTASRELDAWVFIAVLAAQGLQITAVTNRADGIGGSGLGILRLRSYVTEIFLYLQVTSR